MILFYYWLPYLHIFLPSFYFNKCFLVSNTFWLCCGFRIVSSELCWENSIWIWGALRLVWKKRHLKETLRGVTRLPDRRYGQDRLFESGRKGLNDAVVWLMRLESKLCPENLKAVGQVGRILTSRSLWSVELLEAREWLHFEVTQNCAMFKTMLIESRVAMWRTGKRDWRQGCVHGFALVSATAFSRVPCEINSNAGWNLTVKAF